MRLRNYPFEVPNERLQWGTIPIPFVINHHFHKAEKEALQKRRPETELKYSMKYYDPKDRRAVRRFLGAVDDMIAASKVTELTDMGAVGKIKELINIEDLKLTFNILSTIVQAVSKDPRSAFSKELLSDDGLDMLLVMMTLDEKYLKDSNQKIIDQYVKMIRGNAVYIFGNLIANGLHRIIMDPPMVDLLLEKSEDNDPVARTNALFCFRMTMETDPNFWFDFEAVFARAIEMLHDPEDPVKEEALKTVLAFLNEDIVPGEYVAEKRKIIENLSKSNNIEIVGTVENILYILKERMLIED